MGGIIGYSVATGGQTPWMKTVAILPPEISTNTTLVDVGNYLEDKPQPKFEYSEGFNCVEDAILYTRQANWYGIEASPVTLFFDDGSGHMIVAIPTVDNGYTFIEPQANIVINPYIGGYYFGKKIVDIRKLVYQWVPLDWEAVK